MTPETTRPVTKPIGQWKGGFLLARASWTTLTLDKELALFPFYSFVTSLVVTALIGLIIWASGYGSAFMNMIMSGDKPHTLGWVLLLGAYYISQMLVSNFFTVALISSALHRFTGNDPSLNYGIRQARTKWWSITQYTLLSSTVGLVMQAIEDNTKLPIISRLLAFVVDIAWRVATIFALPVIAASTTPVGPITAIKKSANVFKKVWTKDFTGGLGLGAIIAIAMIPMFFLTVLVVILSLNWIGLSALVTIPLVVALWIPFITFTSALNGIFHAALYHYAETGESPEKFDKQLLRAAFVPKKKWFA